MRVTDPEGRVFLDFAGGIACQNTGHRFAPVVDAIHRQADLYLHQCFMVGVYEPYVDTCRLLAELSPCVGTFRDLPSPEARDQAAGFRFCGIPPGARTWSRRSARSGSP